jgi:hypothetical protein
LNSFIVIGKTNESQNEIVVRCILKQIVKCYDSITLENSYRSNGKDHGIVKRTKFILLIEFCGYRVTVGEESLVLMSLRQTVLITAFYKKHQTSIELALVPKSVTDQEQSCVPVKSVLVLLYVRSSL